MWMAEVASEGDTWFAGIAGSASTVGPVSTDQFLLTGDQAFGMGVRFAPRSTPVASGVPAFLAVPRRRSLSYSEILFRLVGGAIGA